MKQPSLIRSGVKLFKEESKKIINYARKATNTDLPFLTKSDTIVNLLKKSKTGKEWKKMGQHEQRLKMRVSSLGDDIKSDEHER